MAVRGEYLVAGCPEALSFRERRACPRSMVRGMTYTSCRKLGASKPPEVPLLLNLQATFLYSRQILQDDSVQKVVVARGRELHLSDASAVHQDIVGEPEIEIGQVFGHDALDFTVELPAPLAVSLHAGLVDQDVKPRVAIVASVGAVRRDLARVENELKDVRVVIAAHPAQGVELKVAASDVSVESGKFKRA